MKRLYGYEGINVSNQYVKKKPQKHIYTTIHPATNLSTQPGLLVFFMALLCSSTKPRVSFAHARREPSGWVSGRPLVSIPADKLSAKLRWSAMEESQCVFVSLFWVYAYAVRILVHVLTKCVYICKNWMITFWHYFLVCKYCQVFVSGMYGICFGPKGGTIQC